MNSMYNCSKDCQFGHDQTAAHLAHHIERGIPTKISYGQVGLLPKRNFFVNKTLADPVAKQLAGRRPMLFMPTSVYERDIYERGKSTYKIYLFGVFVCGSKAAILINDVDVYFDVMVPDEFTQSQFESIVIELLTRSKVYFKKVVGIERFRLHGFQKTPRPYVRIYFNSLKDRRAGIDVARKSKMETASDDLSYSDYYFQLVAREHRFATADWNRISDYIVRTDNTPINNCKYVLSVPISGIQKLGKKFREELVKNPILRNAIERDPTMTCMWDIETYRTGTDPSLPTVKDNDFTIFMMCSVYFWHHSDKPLISICAVCAPVQTHPNISVMIECESEREVLLAHMMSLGSMAPDILGAFNGGNFDWPLYRVKLQRMDLLGELYKHLSAVRATTTDVTKWCFKSENVKIDAENTHRLDCVARFAGILDTDVLPVFLRLYPRAEVRKVASLNFFLSKNGLESKEDMPYKRMFRIYERSMLLAKSPDHCHCGGDACECCKQSIREIDPDTPTTKCCYCSKRPQCERDMADVGYYCVVDCIRPQQLYVKRTIIPDKRELSTMSYVKLYDAFYRADGMKVCNVIGAYCSKRGVAFSNITLDKSPNEKDHYPGGWVCEPNRGLHNDRPITGLDFNSLYPSLMMTYNLSPDMVVYEQSHADTLIREGYVLHRIEPFEYEKGEKKGSPHNKKLTGSGWTVRHNGIVYNESHIITKYNKILVDGRPKYEPVYGREKLPGERMGIFSFIVKKLFDKRVPVKREFVRLTKLKEQYDMGVKIDIDIDDLIFNLNKIDSKQRALKVLANTFYGKSGDFRSPIYELLVAAGITCAGQQNIKKVADYVASRGFITHYGDSVTADTPILCKWGNIVKYVTIDQLGTEWTQYGDKEAALCDAFVWSDLGWTKINRVIRHYTDKDIYRVLTGIGCVDVTSDHSLLDANAMKIRPVDVSIGTPLLHCELPPDDIYEYIDNEQSSCAGDPHYDKSFDKSNDKLSTARVYHMLYNHGYKVGVNINTEGKHIVETGHNYDDKVREIIKLPAKNQYVYDLETENHHFMAGVGRMVVHNTDSLYIACDNSVFSECDAEYHAAMAEIGPDAPKQLITPIRVNWWTKMVKITMEVMSRLKEDVTDFLLNDNGTLYLNMAYEEVGFPTVFCGKKKYFMTPHIDEVNFYSKNIMVRGIDIIKQGQSGISKQLGTEFMEEALSPENHLELIDLAENKIRKFYEIKQDPSLFTLSARYKPDKNNVPVHTFVARMKEMAAKYMDTDPALAALYEPPTPGDKFEYIVVVKPVSYTIQGNRIDPKKGDQMEYLRVYLVSQLRPNPMQIDINYYMKQSVVGLFARFIAYHPKFQPAGNITEYSLMDKTCVDNAARYLNQLCDNITGYDRSALTKQGVRFRAVYKKVESAARFDLISRYGTSSAVIYNLDPRNCEDSLSGGLLDQLKNLAVEMAIDHKWPNSNYITNCLKHMDIFKLRRIYLTDKGQGLSTMRRILCERKEREIIGKLRKIIGKVGVIIYNYEKNITSLINDMRILSADADTVDIDDVHLNHLNGLSQEDKESLNKVYDHWIKLIGVYRVKNHIKCVMDAIRLEKARIMDDDIIPDINTRAEAINDAAKAEILEPYGWK